VLYRLFFCLLVCSCKPLHETKSVTSIQITPKRTVKSPKIPSSRWGSVEFDEKGVLLNNLILSLDYLTGAPNSGSKPQCMKPLADGMVLGEIRCFKGANQKASLTVSHTRQECYTSPDAKKVIPSKEIALPGCHKATVYGFDFDPVIRVDVE